MTLDEFIVNVFPVIQKRRVEAERELAPIGITKTDISSLRKIFGISKTTDQKPYSTEEQIQGMIEMAELGYTHKVIGEKFNLSQTRVSVILKKRGVELKHHVPFTKIQDMRLRHLCEKKTPWREIAEQMGMPYWKIKNRAQTLKLSNNRPSGFQKGNNGWAMRMAKKARLEKENTK